MKLQTNVIEILDDCLQINGNRIFTSLEGHHPGGSIKDHLVKGELEKLLNHGKIKPGDTVAEMSAGSTALSLTHYCRQYALNCVLFVPDTLPLDFLTLLKRSAEVHCVPLDEALEKYQDYCQTHPVHPFDQLGDSQKRNHYVAFADEVSRQVGPVDWVVGAVGTGHSLIGIGLRLRARIVSAEPVGFSISGIRNIEETRWGPRDACIPSLFDERQILSEAELNSSGQHAGSTLETSEGTIEYCESFSLVLQACQNLTKTSKSKSFFLVGAKNRLALKTEKPETSSSVIKSNQS